MSREAWREFRPRVLPPSWYPGEDCASGAGKIYHRADGLLVLASVRKESDGRVWAHVSCSYRDRLPSYADLVDVKAVLFGADRAAYQVFPRERDHVNIHPYVLHLWGALDGDDPIPAFNRDPERGGGI